MEFRCPNSAKASTRRNWCAGWSSPATRSSAARLSWKCMTDKATMEVPRRSPGTITALRAEPGQQIKVGDVVLTYDRQPEPMPHPDRGNARPSRRSGHAQRSPSRSTQSAPSRRRRRCRSRPPRRCGTWPASSASTSAAFAAAGRTAASSSRI